MIAAPIVSDRHKRAVGSPACDEMVACRDHAAIVACRDLLACMERCGQKKRVRKIAAPGSPDNLLLNDGVHGLNLGVLNDSRDLQLLDAKAHRHQLGCAQAQDTNQFFSPFAFSKKFKRYLNQEMSERTRTRGRISGNNYCTLSTDALPLPGKGM